MLDKSIDMTTDDSLSNFSRSVTKKFEQSATTYQQGAQLQRKVAAKLMSRLPNTQSEFGLDLGCGPGLFNEQLVGRCDKLVSLDMSLAMLANHPSADKKICADAHFLPFIANRFDWVLSSLMIQWCQLDNVLAEIRRVLKPGGKAVVSTLCEGSLIELQQSWAQVDQYNHVHNYLSRREIIEALNRQQWGSLKVEIENEVLAFAEPKQLAKELKLLGANYVSGAKQKGLMGKDKWQRMSQYYQQHFGHPNQQGIRATYQVVYIEVTK